MSLVQLHLATNHLPLFGMLFGLIIIVVAQVWASRDLKRFMLYYFVGLGFVTMVVFLTGEPAEEAIEHAPGFSEAIIEKHEDASKAGLVTVELVAALSLFALLRRKVDLLQNGKFYSSLLILVLISLGTMGWVSALGGKIRHTEIQSIPSTPEPFTNGGSG